jgi:predicted RNA-binding protein YlqC (UPF0109 family)
MLKQLVTYFVSKLVDNPTVVVISEITSDDKNIIEIRVAPQDLSRVIGKEGRTFKALRSLVNAVDPQTHKDIVVDAIA